MIDPDKIKIENLENLIYHAEQADVDYFFIGGSLLLKDQLDASVEFIKKLTNIPVILFPGNPLQICTKADAILFLSLISGRNPDLLIGNHVIAAPYLKASELEVIPTGYMLIDGGTQTSVQYMSNTSPIPSDKVDIALSTVMAGEMLGLKILYLEAGSGAKIPVSDEMIKAISKTVSVPILVGGGIKSPNTAAAKVIAGADMVVVGNAIEKNPNLIIEMANAVHEVGK